jgi:hypothetical protein
VGQYSDSSTGTSPGFIYDGENYTTLTLVSPVGGVLVVNAQGINNNGLVTGFYSTDNTTTPVDGNEPQHGFFYDKTTGHYTLVADPNQRRDDPDLEPGRIQYHATRMERAWSYRILATDDYCLVNVSPGSLGPAPGTLKVK